MDGLFSFRIDGGDDVKKGLGALQTRATDLRPFWRDVFAPKYFGVVQDLFATGGRARSAGGRFAGGAWASLSPRYRAWKQKHYPGQPILVRTGELRESVRWAGSANGGVGPGGVFRAEPGFAVVGTTVPYAKWHQTGTATMPARPFLPDPDPNVFAPLLKAWLVRAGRAS